MPSGRISVFALACVCLRELPQARVAIAEQAKLLWCGTHVEKAILKDHFPVSLYQVRYRLACLCNQSWLPLLQDL